MKNWKTTMAILGIMLLILPELSSQSSVWKIEGKGNTMFLGGTIHLLRPSDYPLPAEFDLAYAQASTIVFEADLKQMENPEISQSIVAKSMYPAGETLSKSIKKETYEALKSEFAKLNIPMESLEQYKPSMVILTLTMVKMQGFGVSAEGVDKRYYDKSLEDGKNFGFFETIDQQIDMIVNMGEGNEDAMIMHSLEDLDNMEKDFDELLSDWKHGSTNIMDKQIKEMKNDYPALYKSLLVDRNNDWMPAIDQYLENSEVEFILVGTLHLHGSDGLLALLKDQGYTVTQVIGSEK